MAEVLQPVDWVVSDSPDYNTRACATIEGVPGRCHVAVSLSATYVAGPQAPVAAVRTLTLRDGDPLTGPVLASWAIGTTGVPGATSPFGLTQLGIKGSPGASMTWEFDATGPNQLRQSVTMTGFDVQG